MKDARTTILCTADEVGGIKGFLFFFPKRGRVEELLTVIIFNSVINTIYLYTQKHRGISGCFSLSSKPSSLSLSLSLSPNCFWKRVSLLSPPKINQ